MCEIFNKWINIIRILNKIKKIRCKLFYAFIIY